MRKTWLVSLLLMAAFAAPGWALEGVQPGMAAPPISLEAFDGSPVTLTGFPGARAILVVFWATWSAKSPELLERVEKLAVLHRGRGLAVLGVNVESPTATDAERARVKAMIGRLGLSFPVAVDRGLQVFHAYGVVAVPSSVLVAADGGVVATLAAYPIAGREEFFDLVEATAAGRPVTARPGVGGPRPNARAARYFSLGRALAARGLIDQAEGSFKKAIELDQAFVLPRIAVGQLNRERALVRDGIRVGGQVVPTRRQSAQEQIAWLADAELHLTAAVKLDPGSAAALTELAQVHVARGEVARAQALLERAMAVDPSFPPAQSHLGALLMAAGDVDGGTARLEAAIVLNPLDWRLHATAAEAYAGRGLVRRAVDGYRRGVELLRQARRDRGSEGR